MVFRCPYCTGNGPETLVGYFAEKKTAQSLPDADLHSFLKEVYDDF